jgi:hypothetical protein
MKVMKIDDVVGYFTCDYDGFWKKNYETETQFIIQRVDEPDIAVIDKGTIVREGSKLLAIDAMKPLQMLQNIETEWYYQEQLAKPMYSSLEQILDDMQQQKRHLTIMEKLQNSINNGKYISNGTE